GLVGGTLGPAHVGAAPGGPGQGPSHSAASMPYPLDPSKSGQIATGTMVGAPAMTAAGMAAPGSSAHAQVAASSASSSRGLLIGLAALVLLLALGGVGYVLTRHETTAGTAPEPTDLEAELRSQWQPLVEQGRAAMESGEPVRAVELFDQALVIVPGDREIRALRETAETMLDSDLTLEQAMVRERLGQAEAAITAGDYGSAVELLRAALEIDPEHEEGLEMLARAEEGQQRLEDAKDRVQGRFRRPVVNTGGGSSSGGTAPEPAEAAKAALAIQFDTRIPEGILTVYVGSTKIYHQSFKLPGGGRLSHGAEVPAGPAKLRVYVWRNGSTEAKELSADLVGDSSHTLRIGLDAHGVVAASLE
ncbi:MAG: bacterial transcriptional activator domain-containing protein, partial [Holophagales bacterium]|nr:bacterial transcriptional activator domain-containing protein [Holophagales bacterium]